MAKFLRFTMTDGSPMLVNADLVTCAKPDNRYTEIYFIDPQDKVTVQEGFEAVAKALADA